MSRDCELDRLKTEEQSAFKRKQAAWATYAEARDRTSAAHDKMEDAWQERSRAREVMNREFESWKSARDHDDELWAEYQRVREYNSPRIDALRAEADAEHQAMIDAFDRASDAYEYGDKSEAPYLASEGHSHKDHRDALNAEVGALIQEIKDARAYAESSSLGHDSSAFHSAKAEFEHAKAVHESAEAEFKRLKTERDHAKAAFDSANAEHMRLKEAFQRRLSEVKAANQRERDKVLDRSGVRWSDRQDAKIVKKSDGTTQVYSGGLGGGDGLGHGHVVLDSTGHKTYARDAFASHGSQNFTDKKEGSWTHREMGVILGRDRDYQVTFAQGIGEKEGQTIIADGHLSKRQFQPHNNHNHYGPDIKYSNGSERIEEKGGDRGKYTGPGH